MAFKFTMMFNFMGSGFSETWYYNGNVSFPVPQASVFDQVVQARGLLTGSFTVAQGWRLSDLANPRVTFTRLYSKVNTSGLKPDNPSNAWLAEVRGTNGVGRRQLWLRCIPDAWINWSDEDERFTPTGPLQGALDGYAGLLRQPPWAIRTIQSLQASTSKVRVTGVSAGPTGGTILTVNFAGLNPLQSIVVSGFRKPLGVLNGTYDSNSGYSPGTTNITLTHKAVAASDAAGYVSGAWIRQQVFGYQNIASVDLIAPRERKVGRAFFVPRGRRSVR